MQKVVRNMFQPAQSDDFFLKVGTPNGRCSESSFLDKSTQGVIASLSARVMSKLLSKWFLGFQLQMYVDRFKWLFQTGISCLALFIVHV